MPHPTYNPTAFDLDDPPARRRQLHINLAISAIIGAIRTERRALEAESVGVTKITLLADSKAALQKIFDALDAFDAAEKS